MKRLSVLLMAMSILSCERGGGDSATSPARDGIFQKAEARADGQIAAIELERTTRSAVAPGESATEQSLRLQVLDRSEHATLVLARDDDAGSYTSHKLQFSPRADRVAYQLGQDDWSVVYLLPPSLALRAAATYPALNWREVPTLEAAFPQLYDAQRVKITGATFDSPKADALVAWMRQKRGDLNTAPLLVRLLELDRVPGWPKYFESLEEAGKSRARADLRNIVAGEDANANHFEAAWTTGAIDLTDASQLEVVKRGAAVLTADRMVEGAGEAAAAYLRALHTHDAAAARALACPLYAAHGEKPVMREGRPLRTALDELGVAADGCP